MQERLVIPYPKCLVFSTWHVQESCGVPHIQGSLVVSTWHVQGNLRIMPCTTSCPSPSFAFHMQACRKESWWRLSPFCGACALAFKGFVAELSTETHCPVGTAAHTHGIQIFFQLIIWKPDMENVCMDKRCERLRTFVIPCLVKYGKSKDGAICNSVSD